MKYEKSYCDHRWNNTTEVMRKTLEHSDNPDHQKDFSRTCRTCLTSEWSPIPFDVNPKEAEEHRRAA